MADDMLKNLKEAIEALNNMDGLDKGVGMMDLLVKKSVHLKTIQSALGEVRKKEFSQVKKIFKENKALWAGATKYNKAATKAARETQQALMKSLKLTTDKDRKAFAGQRETWKFLQAEGNAEDKRNVALSKSAVYGEKIADKYTKIAGMGRKVYAGLQSPAAASGMLAQGVLGAGRGIKAISTGAAGKGVAAAMSNPYVLAGTVTAAAFLGKKMLGAAASLALLDTRVEASQLAVAAFGTNANELNGVAREYHATMGKAANANRMQATQVESLTKLVGTNATISLEKFTDANNKNGLSLQNIRKFSAGYGVSLEESANALVLGRDLYRRNYKVGQADMMATKDLTRARAHATSLQKRGYGPTSFFLKSITETASSMQDSRVSYEGVGRTMKHFMTANTGIAATRTGAAAATQRLGQTLTGMGGGMQMLMAGGGLGGMAKWTKSSFMEKQEMARSSSIGQMMSGLMQGDQASQGAGILMGKSLMPGMTQQDTMNFWSKSMAGGVGAGGEAAMDSELSQLNSSLTEIMGKTQETFQELNTTMREMKVWFQDRD